MATPRMLMLAVTFCYTGLMLTFWSGVYGTSIGRTKKFGEDAKSLVGLHGIVIGAGEIIGGKAKAYVFIFMFIYTLNTQQARPMSSIYLT